VIVTLPHASRVRGGSTSSRWRQIAGAQGPGRTEISAGVVHAVSLRLREQALGAMNLFSSEPVGLGQPDRTIAQALAEVATVAILGQGTILHSGEVAAQLQTARNSRVIIEQAKGMPARQSGLAMAAAFAVLREHARRNNQRVTGAAPCRGRCHADPRCDGRSRRHEVTPLGPARSGGVAMWTGAAGQVARPLSAARTFLA
jgi:ANTAR domain